MRSKSVKPSAYPALPFHAIRAIGFLSSLIVAIILAVFIYHLSKDSYKLPWAFLVLLISSILSLLNYILTAITNCTTGLSPRLSLTLNSILFIVWLIGLALLCWSMSSTITTTCNATFWANSTGIAVCRVYKTLFSFTAIGAAAHVASIVLDVVVHRRQTRLGAYDPMASSTALNDYKMHDRNSSVLSGTSIMMADHPQHQDHPAFRNHGPDVDDDDARSPLYPGNPYHQRQHSDQDFYDIPDPAARPSRHNPPPVYGSDTLEQYHVREAQEYADSAPARSEHGMPRVRFSAYEPGYGHAAERTGYDPGAYRDSIP